MKKNFMAFLGILLLSGCVDAPTKYSDRALRVGDYAVEVCAVIIIVLMVFVLLVLWIKLDTINTTLKRILEVHGNANNINYDDNGRIVMVNGFRINNQVKGPKGIATIEEFEDPRTVRVLYENTKIYHTHLISELTLVQKEETPVESKNGFAIGDVVKFDKGEGEIMFLHEKEVIIKQGTNTYIANYSEIEKVQ